MLGSRSPPQPRTRAAMPRQDAPPPFHGFVPLRNGWDLVIKVKYAGTLKRFNACVNGSHFDHNLAALRSKIANAFKFNPDAEFILTYTDEDGDVVMLDDDDDLRDAAISQKLNPLRIDVQLKSSSAGAPQIKQQSSNSRSQMSTALEDQLTQVKSAIDEALKFVPEQVHVLLTKLSHDLRSKAASSAPSLAELLDRFAKLITPKCGMQPFSGPADGSSVSSSNGPQTLGNLKINHESEHETFSASQPSDMQNPKSLGLKSVLVEQTKAQVEQASGYPSAEDTLISSSSSGRIFDLKRRTDAQSKGKSHARSRGKSIISSSVPPVDAVVHGVPTIGSTAAPSIGDLRYGLSGYTPFGSNGKIDGDLHSLFPPPKDTSYCPIPRLGDNGKINGGLQTAFPPPPAYNYNPFRFNMPSAVSPYGHYQEGVCSFDDSYRDLVWRSKHDYDLCGTCFSHTGNEAEYNRIDKPTLVSERMRDIDKDRRLQLDCRFIKDVTVPDGTIMAPSTPFTKIWRMCNSGSTMWPFGTQLTWVGGDEFARQSSVKLGITENGFPVDQEVNIGVEFVAPVKPGRYISCWRLASPDFQKFGQQVWVFIQVEQPVKTSGNKQTAAMNLNLPAEGNTTTCKPFVVDLNVEPTDLAYEYSDYITDLYQRALLHHEAIKAKRSEAVRSDVPSAPTAGEPIQVSLTDPGTSSTGAIAVPAGVPAPEAIPLPKPATTLVSAPVPVPAHAPAPAPVAASLPNEIVNDMEEKLLRELEDMGFSQFDLNKQILRQNEYDLLKSVDDLCGFHEWDPRLTELHELGLDDTEAREVLAKDDGGRSIIKRVAMNLL